MLLPGAGRNRLQRPISIEWEDAGMDRLHGAPEAVDALKKYDFASNASFDDAFHDQD